MPSCSSAAPASTSRRGLSAAVAAVLAAAVILCGGHALAGPARTSTGLPAGIVGGTRTTVSDYPTVVAVLNVADGDIESLCTGTLIHPEWVLTAAHCLEPDELGVTTQAEVTARTVIAIDTTTALVASSGRRIQAAATFPHPSFDDQNLGDNDIGLIKLSQKITDRRMTALNRSFDAAKPGISVVMVGFGATTAVQPAPGEPSSAGTEFVIKDRVSARCSTLPIGSTRLDDANVLCFSQKDAKGKCNGDSGGPSFASINGITHVVGVTSFGDEDCKYMGADTRVDAEMSFLEQHIADLACVHDGVCHSQCGQNGLPADGDCSIGGPRGLGAVCTGNGDCDSDLCGKTSDLSICTERCVKTDPSSCPAGFACTITSGDAAVCWPAKKDDGGCSTTGGAGGLGTLAIALGLLVARRRPSTRAS